MYTIIGIFPLQNILELSLNGKVIYYKLPYNNMAKNFIVGQVISI